MRLATILLTLGVLAVSCSSGGGPAEASQTPTATSSLSGSPSPEESPSQTSSGLPSVTLTPDSGPVGTRIRMSGSGFVEPRWPYGSGVQTTIILELTGAGAPRGCALVAEPFGRARVDAEGHLTGSFVVPSRGLCRQDFHEPPRQPRLVQGQYVLSLACTACFVGSFRVTSG